MSKSKMGKGKKGAKSKLTFYLKSAFPTLLDQAYDYTHLHLSTHQSRISRKSRSAKKNSAWKSKSTS